MQQHADAITISPDGQWVWNGAEWVPNAANTMTNGYASPPAVRERPKKKRIGLKVMGGILGVLLILGIATSGGDDAGTAPASQDVATAPIAADEGETADLAAADRAAEEKAAADKAAADKAAADKAAEEEAAEEEAAPTETRAQKNAVRSAESYLDTMAFSRSGLIDQLEYEGYSTKDATYAVDTVSPNWNEQAAKAAESYLDTMAFSRSGLIEQLEYEGYTHKQAVYGVDKAGL